MPFRRNVADDHLGRTFGFHRAIVIRIADDLVRCRDVDILRIGRRLKCDAVGPVQVLGEDFGLGRRAARFACAEHEHASGATLRQEDIAVRRDAQRARLLEPACEHLHREALRHFRYRALLRIDDLRAPRHRAFGVRAHHRRWQIGRPDVAANPGGVGLPVVANGSCSGAHLGALSGCERSATEELNRSEQDRDGRRVHVFLHRQIAMSCALGKQRHHRCIVFDPERSVQFVTIRRLFLCKAVGVPFDPLQRSARKHSRFSSAPCVARVVSAAGNGSPRTGTTPAFPPRRSRPRADFRSPHRHARRQARALGASLRRAPCCPP